MHFGTVAQPDRHKTCTNQQKDPQKMIVTAVAGILKNCWLGIVLPLEAALSMSTQHQQNPTRPNAFLAKNAEGLGVQGHLSQAKLCLVFAHLRLVFLVLQTVFWLL